MEDRFVKAIYTNDPDTYAEMMANPNTPGHGRYIQAARDYYEWEYQNDLKEDDDTDEFVEGFPSEDKALEEFNDIDHYADVVITRLWEEGTIESFHDYLSDDPGDGLGTVVWMLTEHISHSAFGIATCEHFPASNETHISFTRLYRHPDWMGFSPVITEITGFTAFVFLDPDKNTPSFVILTDNAAQEMQEPKEPREPGEPKVLRDQYDATFPPGEATVLKDLLTALNAKAVLRVPWDGDPGHYPPIPLAGELIAVPVFETDDLYEEIPSLKYNSEEVFDVREQKIVEVVPYQEMITCPHTPSEEQYLQAYEDLKHHIQQCNDGEAEPLQAKPFHQYAGIDHYLELHQRDQHAAQASYIFQLKNTHKDGAPTLEAIMDAAAGASTDATIGIAAYDPEERHSMDSFIHINIFRLSRHPDWMGMEPFLQSLDLHQALIFEKPGTKTPHFVIIAPRSNHIPQHLSDVPFPHGQASMLKEVLSYHGILPMWVPSDSQFNPGDYIKAP